jgi:hypothetical protein
VFDFESGNTDGFANWRREQERRLDAIRGEWGLPVGRNVRLRVRTIEGELEGKLRMIDMPVSIDRRVPLHLRISGIDIEAADIERCTVID